MPLSEDFIYKLIQNNPIENIISSYASLTKKGSDYICLCPFHSEKTPSFRIYASASEPHFYCFGCHAGGNVITFIMRAENLSYIEAVKFLAEKSGMEMPDNNLTTNESKLKTRIFEMNREAGRFFYKNLVMDNRKTAIAYFKKRGVAPQTVKKYGLGYACDSWNMLYNHLKNLGFSDDEIISANLCRKNSKGNFYDFFRNRIMFPIFDLRGNVIAFGGRVLDNSLPKYLNSPDTPVFRKSRNLFSLNFAKNSSSKKLILAEGYMDVIALNQAGFQNAVATLGTSLTQEQSRIMANYAKEVVIAYDSDTAGQNASHRAINLLSNAGISVKILKMEGAKDPDEYIKKFGSERFRLLMDKSEEVLDFEFRKCREGLDMLSESGKIKFLERVSDFLSSVPNPIERNVYISRSAHECDITKEALTSYVNSKIKMKAYSKEKKQWQTIKNVKNIHDNLNPDADIYPKESRAEESIILYILRNPDFLEKIYSKIPPEKFITAFNRRVYECIIKKSEILSDFSISMFSDEFNVEEMGRITELDVKNREVDFNWQTVIDCINVILESNENMENKNSQFVSDEQLIELQKKLINTKQEE